MSFKLVQKFWNKIHEPIILKFDPIFIATNVETRDVTKRVFIEYKMIVQDVGLNVNVMKTTWLLQLHANSFFANLVVRSLRTTF